LGFKPNKRYRQQQLRNNTGNHRLRAPGFEQRYHRLRRRSTLSDEMAEGVRFKLKPRLSH